MSRTPTIVEITDQPPDDWRGLVAGLCFIEFYTGLIFDGQWLHRLVTDSWQPWGEREMFAALQAGLGLILAVMFWGLGRAVWRRYPTTGRWLARVIVCVLLLAFVKSLSMLADFRRSVAWGGIWWGIKPDSVRHGALIKVWRVFEDCYDLLPLAVLIVCIALFVWRKQNTRRGGPRPWVIIAGAWAISFAIVQFGHGGWPCSVLSDWIRSIVGVDTGLYPAMAFVVLPLLVGICIIAGKRGAVLLSITILLLSLLRLAAAADRMLPWGDIAIGFHQTLYSDYTFHLLFVWPVSEAGPWLLISFYALRYPLRLPPDDGSPLPARYCARCHYNLFGIDSARCPECGAVL